MPKHHQPDLSMDNADRPRRDWFTMQPRGACICDGGTIRCPWCADGCRECSGVGWYRCYGCDQFEKTAQIDRTTA